MSATNNAEQNSSTTLDIRELSNLMQLADNGAEGVESNLGMLGDDASMIVRRLDFFDIVSRHDELDDEKRVAIRARLNGKPGGHLLIMFTLQSAQKITRLMLSDVADSMEEVDQQMAQSAAEELGNMMISGFVDGWADYLTQTIDHAAPKLVYAPGSKIVKQTATMGDNPLAIKYDCAIESSGTTIPTEVFLFPELDQLVQMVRESGGE